MAKKYWYDVTIIAEKRVRIYAEDAQDAKNKADAKYEPKFCVKKFHIKI